MRWMGLVLAVLGCDHAPACDAGTLAAQLAGAAEGDVVEVGACEIAGRFRVPPGVTLLGTDPASAIRADTIGPALRTMGAVTQPTVIRGLRITSRQHAAVWIESAGAVVLEDLTIVVPEGVGVAADGAASVRLARVGVEGGVTSGAGVPADPVAMDHATHGLALFRVASAQLEDVDLSGFARFGALFVDGATRWEGGGVHDSLATGVMVSGGSAELVDLTLEALWGDESLVPSYGLVIAKGASVESARLMVRDNAQIGVLQDGSVSEHTDLTVQDNGDVGVWAQDALGLRIMGSGSALARNEAAGIALIDARAVSLADAIIEDTRLARAARDFGLVEAGEGIQIVGGRDIELTGLRLSGNDRAQILVDVAGTFAREIVLDGVSVDGTGTELGLILQSETPPAGWDASVTRLGVTEANDLAHTGTFDTLSGVVADDVPSEPAGGDPRGIIMPVD